MNPPLVSIICTCYNHAPYISDALDSLSNQSYRHLELIIIDNGSRDNSVARIQEWIANNKISRKIRTVFHAESINYCRSFNQGLAIVKGKYIIDLSGDDVLLRDHIKNAVENLERSPAGVYFCNAYLEQENSLTRDVFYPVNQEGKPIKVVPFGDIYKHVVQKNFLCPPTLVFKAEILINEGGYDESLAYEDFDIIVRLARKHAFVFNDYIGVKKRVLKTSFSANQYKTKSSVMLPSTLQVCRKIHQMNLTVEENNALKFRIRYEVKHALASANFVVGAGLLDLAKEVGLTGLRYQMFKIWARTRFDLSPLYERIMLR